VAVDMTAPVEIGNLRDRHSVFHERPKVCQFLCWDLGYGRPLGLWTAAWTRCARSFAAVAAAAPT
jgi:hypothetical protein